MLVVRVLPTSGNPNNLFGYHGIWGLEPVYVCGKIGCTYDERASGKPPKVKSVQVCLVRLEMVRNTTAREKMAAATIWTPPDGQESAEVGQVDIPFELALPEDVKGMSSMTMFPTARVLYLVEASESEYAKIRLPSRARDADPSLLPGATLASGRNITAENKTMHVVRFARSPMDPSSTSPISWSSSTVFDQPIPFEYSVRIPNVLLTPEEYLPVYITVKAPEDAPGPVHLKGYELSTKRQIHLASTGAPSGPIETTTFAYESEILAARTERPSTRANGPKKRPIIPDSEGMEIETDPPGLPIFEKDTFPMVLQPGESRTGMARLRMRERGFHAWSYGETGTNDAFRIQFYLAFKVRVCLELALSTDETDRPPSHLAVLPEKGPLVREHQAEMAPRPPVLGRRLSGSAPATPRPVPLAREHRQLRRVRAHLAALRAAAIDQGRPGRVPAHDRPARLSVRSRSAYLEGQDADVQPAARTEDGGPDRSYRRAGPHEGATEPSGHGSEAVPRGRLGHRGFARGSGSAAVSRLVRRRQQRLPAEPRLGSVLVPVAAGASQNPQCRVWEFLGVH